MGTGLGGGVVFGAAALLRFEDGVPLLSDATEACLSNRRGSDETLEVVLIVEKHEHALGVLIPGVRVVGVLAEESSNSSLSPRITAVTGLPGLMECVEDGAFIIMDGARGTVLVDPEPAAIAFYQGDRERLAPRKRISLDFADYPARTLGGRLVHVIARTVSIEEVGAAVEAGADGIYIPAGSGIVQAEASDEEQMQDLLRLANRARCGPIIISGDASTVSATALLRAAEKAEFALAIGISEDAEPVSRTQQHFHQLRDGLYADGVDCGDIQFVAIASKAAPLPLEESFVGLSRLLAEVPEDDSWSGAGSLEWLEELITAARIFQLPVVASVNGWEAGQLDMLLAAGVSGIIVAPDHVQDAKGHIRETELG